MSSDILLVVASSLLALHSAIGAHLVRELGRLSRQVNRLSERISHLEGKGAA